MILDSNGEEGVEVKVEESCQKIQVAMTVGQERRREETVVAER